MATSAGGQAVRQLVVSPMHWDYLVGCLARVGFVVVELPLVQEDLPTYVIHPRAPGDSHG